MFARMFEMGVGCASGDENMPSRLKSFKHEFPLQMKTAKIKPPKTANKFLGFPFESVERRRGLGWLDIQE